jgi:hypothetical protein
MAFFERQFKKEKVKDLIQRLRMHYKSIQSLLVPKPGSDSRADAYKICFSLLERAAGGPDSWMVLNHP